MLLAWRLLASDRPDAVFWVERRRGEGEPWRRTASQAITDSTTLLDVAPPPLFAERFARVPARPQPDRLRLLHIPIAPVTGVDANPFCHTPRKWGIQER